MRRGGRGDEERGVDLEWGMSPIFSAYYINFVCNYYYSYFFLFNDNNNYITFTVYFKKHI